MDRVLFVANTNELEISDIRAIKDSMRDVEVGGTRHYYAGRGKWPMDMNGK